MRFLRAALIAFVLLASRCTPAADQQADQEQGQGTPEPTTIAKVKVDRRGTIYLDGNEVSLEELKQAFARLKEVDGVVWYHRENPEGEPPPQAMAVVEAVVEAHLPIRLMEEDFE